MVERLLHEKEQSPQLRANSDRSGRRTAVMPGLSAVSSSAIAAGRGSLPERPFSTR